jgi:hypothetical protein
MAKSRASKSMGPTVKPGTPREKDYAEALGVFYEGWEQRSHAARAMAYRDAMRGVHERNPKDQEAAIFYALALVGAEAEKIKKHLPVPSNVKPSFAFKINYATAAIRALRAGTATRGRKPKAWLQTQEWSRRWRRFRIGRLLWVPRTRETCTREAEAVRRLSGEFEGQRRRVLGGTSGDPRRGSRGMAGARGTSNLRCAAPAANGRGP